MEFPGINQQKYYGNKITPVNIERSQQTKTIYYDWTTPYAEQNPADYYLDLSIGWRKDKKRAAYIFTLQVKNVLGSPSGYHWTYNYKTHTVELQSVVVPGISYRIEF